MADTVLYQTDDDLSQANLAASTKRQNAEDYVERGLSLSNYDSGALTVDVSAGHCVLSAGSNAAYDVFPDARSGVSLTGSATNSVYVVIDPTAQDDVTVEALDSGTPANPYLKIGEVDTSADTVSDVSRDPDGTFESVSADRETIGGEPTHDRDAVLSLRGTEDNPTGVILQPLDGDGPEGEDRFNLTWFNTRDPAERLVSVASDHGVFSVYVKTDKEGDGNTPLEKVAQFGHPDGPEDSALANILGAQVVRFRRMGSVLIHDTLQEALTQASSGDKIMVRGGVFEPINITTDGLTLIGSSIGTDDGTKFSASDGTGITINANGVTVESVFVESTGTGPGILFGDCAGSVVRNARFGSTAEEHIRFSANASSCEAGTLHRVQTAGATDSILFENGASGNIVDRYRNSGTVTDDDGSNEVGITT